MNADPHPTKLCRDCSTLKPRGEFHRCSANSDGLQGYCKVCLLARKREWEARGGRAKMNAAQLRYRRRDPDRWLQVQEAWAGRNPRKRSASWRLRKAVYDGRVQKQPCEVCGIRRHVHGHHDDYAKPLDVRWLCALHHREWHKCNGEGKNAA